MTTPSENFEVLYRWGHYKSKNQCKNFI